MSSQSTSAEYFQQVQAAPFMDRLLADIIKEKPENVTRFIASWALKQLSGPQRYAIAEKTIPQSSVTSLFDYENVLEYSALANNLSYNPTTPLPLPTTKTVKVICTIGPQTQSVDGIKGLIRNGMDVARMNFSHGSHAYHLKTIECVRQAAQELGKIIAIALDTKGPEVRTGKIADGPLTLTIGQKINVSTNPEYANKGSKDLIYIDYQKLCSSVSVGGMIYIDDGLLGLCVDYIGKDYVQCTATSNHVLTDFKGCNLAKVNVDLPTVSGRDEEDLKFAVEQGVDMVFASFIRSAAQVKEIRKILGEAGKDMLVISKIENHQGLHHINEIIDESDGIMVARGDLGIEISPEKLFLAQKMIISKCNAVGKPVICATQMLETMTTNPFPLRAEANDVANAIIDGSHSVMLSGETAKGNYPNETVQTMSAICCATQLAFDPFQSFRMVKEVQAYPLSTTESVCSSAVHSAMESGAAAVVTNTKTGLAARMLAKYTPTLPVIAVCQEEKWARRLCILRNVFPIVEPVEGREERLMKGVEYAKSLGILKVGDKVAFVQGDHHTALHSGSPKIFRIVTVE